MKNFINEEISSGAVLYKKENNKIKFLLVYSKRNSEWGFPKGHIEKGETEIEAAKREIFEETGIKLNNDDFDKTFRFSDTYKIKGTLPSTKGKIIDKTSVYYLAGVKNSRDNKKLFANEEIGEMKWMSFEEAVNCLKYPKQKEMLKIAKQFCTQSVRVAEV